MSVVRDIFSWLLIGVVGTLGIWKEIDFINETPVPLSRNALIVGAIAGPLSAMGAIIMMGPTLVYVVSTYDNCVANCDK